MTRLTAAELRSHISLVLYLARAEFARRRAQSFGGTAWMVLVPLATIVTIWIALDLGLGLRAILGPEFGRTLVAGLMIWLFFTEAISSATMSITSQPHLVKKVRFPVILLPVASVLVAAIVHTAVAVVVTTLLVIFGAPLTWSLLLIPVMFAITFLFALGLGILLSGLNIFLPDVGQTLPAITGLWFWLTPIIWPLSRVPEAYQALVFLNPMATPVLGYANALSPGAATVDHWLVLAFFLLVLAFCSVCLYVFARMQYVFSDVM